MLNVMANTTTDAVKLNKCLRQRKMENMVKMGLGSPQAIVFSQATAQAIVRSHRTSVKYTRTTDEMATSYRTNFVRCHRTALYDRTTACGDFVVPLR
uniref:Uncharacterized protein n=1 Tax=Acrobeloides nanus TaxID=290746 RepID=A0A914DVW9_9BILA